MTHVSCHIDQYCVKHNQANTCLIHFQKRADDVSAHVFISILYLIDRLVSCPVNYGVKLENLLKQIQIIVLIVFNKKVEQAGAEQCQAQEKLGLARNCGQFPLIKKLRLSSICLKLEIVFC